LWRRLLTSPQTPPPHAQQQQKKAGPAWGVSLLPPGLDEAQHPELVDIIRSQHRR
jgi:hypothetical protein